MQAGELADGVRVEVPRQERRVDEARPDGADPDVARGVGEGGFAGQAQEAVLGGGVGRGTPEGDGAEDRGHVDDGAAAGALDGGKLVAHAAEHATEIAGDHPVPAVERVVPDRGGGAADPGIVDREMDRAGPLLGEGD